MAAVDVSYDGSLAIQEKAKLRVSRTFFEVVTLGSLLVMCALGLVFLGNRRTEPPGRAGRHRNLGRGHRTT